MTEDSDVYWGHILGAWSHLSTAPIRGSTHFTLWIGGTEGYPTSSIGGADVHQVTYSECRLPTGIGVISVALFTIQSSSPFLGGYHVVAYWEVQPAVYVQAMGTGPDSLLQRQLLAALSTIRVSR